MANENGLYSSVIKSGKNTYFVDVKEAKNGNKYLAITESQAGDPQRKTIRIFGEAIGKFRDAVAEASATIPEQQ
ncbi:MAG TPA: DUF3276 family protein [Candidatus Acidoferrales bacterium]|nr:DUF3276 family protein [Candidatus Acidoferrales bacterium]